MGASSDVVVEVAAGVPEPPLQTATKAGPLDDAHMADVHEEEAMDYKGSTGEEPTVLSFDDEYAWDLTANTPAKHDTSKFTRLSVEDLKTINALDADNPSREIEGNATWLLFCVTRYKFFQP